MAGAMGYLFIGGPGRSGTSFVAERLGRHPEVVSLLDVELKILCEKNGLQDIFHVLVETYSPNRAATALAEIQSIARALITGQYGQVPLTEFAPAETWDACFRRFAADLCEDGHPVAQSAEGFLAGARALIRDIAAIAAAAKGGAPAVFLEKTPHNLLAMPFLSRLAPGARYLHVMRDPRSIAWSLTRMTWGPDTLETAARWVASYCRAWTLAEAEAAERGLPLMRLHIEEAVAHPGATAAAITAWLDVAPAPDLLHDGEPGTLVSWTGRAGAEERALLDRRLGGWVRHFGYDPDEVGRRPAPAA